MKFTNPFAKPTHEQAIKEKLDDARLSLLTAEANLEVALATVQMYRSSVARLQKLQDSLPGDAQ